MIEVNQLSKAFGAKVAVNQLSFTVRQGEVLGFLGPNGAGKSTTMRMITGFLPPTAGSVKVCGFDIVEDPIAAKRKIGYLPEAAPSYADMTVLSFLKFSAELRGLSGSDIKKAVRRVVDLTFLDSVLGQDIETLSKGYKHRTCLAQSLIHDPEVLILDEPTDGLDPNQKHEVRQLIKRMGETKTIIFSTHILEEVEAVCDRAIIIDRGNIVANGTPAELKSSADLAGSVVMTLRAREGSDIQTIQQQVAARPGVLRSEIIMADGARLVLRARPDRMKLQGGSLSGPLAEWAVQHDLGLEDIRVEEGRLDDVFRALTVTDAASQQAKNQARAEAAAEGAQA
ncbi:MAG: transporter ATP-binding protein [Betaproteobacteria bacterium]|nr:transporter ATP-binding protein [Betaproteobacteria bacterium]